VRLQPARPVACPLDAPGKRMDPSSVIPLRRAMSQARLLTSYSLMMCGCANSCNTLISRHTCTVDTIRCEHQQPQRTLSHWYNWCHGAMLLRER
jgi:hypothetical protein